MKWLSLALLVLGSMICLSEALSMDRIKEHFPGPRRRRMVGGIMATTPVPWQAMVFLSDNILDGGFAGGALIAPRWVLTAGRNLFVRKFQEHTKGKEPLIPKVYLGIFRRADASNATEVAVEKVFLHPGFQNTSDWDNDLALIQLKEPVTFSDSVFPIPLPERDENMAERAGEWGIISGWGWGALFTQAETLKFLYLRVVECQGQYSSKFTRNTPYVDNNMFCTEPGHSVENVCSGDAGGALAFLDHKSKRVYAGGILSFDKACNVMDKAVYMKVSAYLPWIHSVMRGDTDKFSSLRTSVMTEMFSRYV
ncbi:haptoglobin [Hoplias malabaricus]|uniref:haptoglobin n=1 Tax=Hoplias malabaricus TaxID=27720 RepID=UPI00346295BB